MQREEQKESIRIAQFRSWTRKLDFYASRSFFGVYVAANTGEPKIPETKIRDVQGAQDYIFYYIN